MAKKRKKQPKLRGVRVEAREVWQNAHREEADIRTEYNRLRDIARKRLKRMESAGYSDLDAYALNVNHYPAISTLKDKWDIASRLTDLQRFINAKDSTVQGIKQTRAKTLNTWRKKYGFEWLDEDNMKDFGNFLNWLKSAFPNVYAVELYRAKEDFTKYKRLRKGELAPDEVERLFVKYLKKTRPDSLIIDEYSRRTAGEYKQSEDSKRRKL